MHSRGDVSKCCKHSYAVLRTKQYLVQVTLGLSLKVRADGSPDDALLAPHYQLKLEYGYMPSWPSWKTDKWM
jgi:hypothetical protein